MINNKNMDVTIYTTPTCPYCQMAKDFLEKNKIQFEEIDVSKDERSAMEVIKKSGHIGVPIIKINDHYVAGFNEEEIKRKLYL